MSPLAPIDPSKNPYLSGLFAPVDAEIEAADLPVIGTIPADLEGAYLRNGPNPKYPPLGSYTYPLDGDGMIHGVWLASGRARYRNRYVLTKGLKAEMRAGRALWGGVMTFAIPPDDLAGADQDPDGKSLPSINIVRHGHRYLALAEGTPPYELTADLATVGRYDFSGNLPLGMCAHPKVDPITGEMILFRYGLEEPYLTWSAIAADGRITHPPEIVAEIDRGYMIHDFMITEDFLVLVINPATFDFARAARGASPLAWEPDLGTRIAIIPRTKAGEGAIGKIRWIETEAFWCWHYANGWQEGEQIVVCFPWWSGLGFGNTAVTHTTGKLMRARIDPRAGTVRFEVLDDRPTEFPRIDERRQGRAVRYATVVHGSPAARAIHTHDELFRLDLKRGTVAEHRFPGQAIGEAVFAPKPGRAEEEAGYILTFATDCAMLQSSLVILDAADFTGEPLARVKLPVRVPLGLHGNWCPAGS